jgi:hypothetical protein
VVRLLLIAELFAIYFLGCAGPPILARSVFRAKSLLILKLLRFQSMLIAALWRRDEIRESPDFVGGTGFSLSHAGAPNTVDSRDVSRRTGI